MGPRDVGSRQQRVTGQRDIATQPEDARSCGRPEAGGDPQREALGQGSDLPAGPHAGAATSDGHQRVRQTDLVTEVGRFGPAPQKSVRAGVDDVSTEWHAVERSPEPGRRFQDEHLRCGGDGFGAVAATGELPCRGQPADATADDHNALHA